MKIEFEIEDFLDYSMKLKFLIIDFIARAAADLSDDNFLDFDFKIKTKDNYVIVTLLYGDDCDSSIMDWHVYLQEKVDELVNALGIVFNEEFVDGVLVLIEHRELWK